MFDWVSSLDSGFWVAAAVGFFAQLIDGALGMGYGAISSTFLLRSGVSPAAASASVHLAEVFTTGFSALAHWRKGNVEWPLFHKLVLPGVVGGVIGAYILSEVPGVLIKPFVSVYLLVLGVIILYKSFRPLVIKQVTTFVRRLALFGGFFDAVGGGGWGPIVTSTLVSRGHHVRQTIGSVNAAEFFVTVAQSVTFFITLGFVGFQTVGGLLIGGLLAAPLAALATGRLPTRLLMVLVGLLIVALNLWTLLK